MMAPAFFLCVCVCVTACGLSSSSYFGVLVVARTEAVGPTGSANAAAPCCAHGSILPGRHVTVCTHTQDPIRRERGSSYSISYSCSKFYKSCNEILPFHKIILEFSFGFASVLYSSWEPWGHWGTQFSAADVKHHVWHRNTSELISWYFLPLLFPRHLVRPPSSRWHQKPLLSSYLQEHKVTFYYTAKLWYDVTDKWCAI